MAYAKEFQLISKPVNLDLTQESESIIFHGNSDIDDTCLWRIRTTVCLLHIDLLYIVIGYPGGTY